MLHTAEAGEIPDWLSQLAEPEVGADERPVGKQTLPTTALQQQLADESEVLGWRIGWLEQLVQGETVVVNLRVELDAIPARCFWISSYFDMISGNRTITCCTPTKEK